MDNLNKKNLMKQAIESGSYPKVLYKYRSISQTEQILDNLSFWFATPDTFNDPFDCSLDDVKNYELEDVFDYLTDLELDDESIKEAIINFKNNPHILPEFIHSAKENTILKKGVLSLSATNENILMWSHYANNHEGAVIGLELSQDLEFFTLPIPIDYTDRYTPLNYLQDRFNAIIDTIRIKSADWNYEQEYRIYKDTTGLHKINPTAIKEIIFGVKTTDKDIRKIKEKCNNGHLKHVTFKKATKKHGEFGLEFTNA